MPVCAAGPAGLLALTSDPKQRWMRSCTDFVLHAKVDVKLYTPNAPLGYFLCLSNLVLDGYTNAAQVQLPCLPAKRRLGRAQQA